MTVFYSLKEQKKGKARSMQQADAELLPFLISFLFNFLSLLGIRCFRSINS